MLNYPEFVVGLWFVPVVLCILTPLAMLLMWSIKRILGDIYAVLKRVESEVAKGEREEAGDVRPYAAA